MIVWYFFFFQAEDGIRDKLVTGVQTCALPIYQKKISINQLFLVASSRSAGQKVNFNGKEHEIFNLETYDFSKAEITFFAAGGKISEKYAEKAAKHTTIIDNSSFFRMDQDVPLIVPQVNPEAIDILKKILLLIQTVLQHN